MELDDLTIDALEKRQEEILNELREVQDEIDLYEEDYRPDLEDQKELLSKELKKINKKLNKFEQL